MNEIEELKIKIENIEKKVDKLLELVENNVIKDCNKMSEHIDFIDNVYDNVKNPLGYICNKINGFTNNKKLENNIVEK